MKTVVSGSFAARFSFCGSFCAEISCWGSGVRVGSENKAERRVFTARHAKCGPENVVVSCWKVIMLLLVTNSI